MEGGEEVKIISKVPTGLYVKFKRNEKSYGLFSYSYWKSLFQTEYS